MCFFNCTQVSDFNNFFHRPNNAAGAIGQNKSMTWGQFLGPQLLEEIAFM